MSTKPVLLINGNPVGDIGGEGGSGGHTIIDSSGTSLTQENELQFSDSFLTDDSTNGRTIVENIKEVDPADYASTTDEGIIVTDDGNDALIGAVSDDKVEVTADGNTTWIDILNYIFNHTDLSKITPNANLYIAGTYHPLVTKTNVLLAFAKTRTISNTQLETSTFVLQASNSHCDDCSLTSGSPASASITDNSTNKPSSGAVITLYYGNRKAVVDLQTTANRCLMPDGTTKVSDLLDSNVAIWSGSVANVTASNAVTMVKPDGTEVSSNYTGMIILQTSTSQGGTGSVYMVRSGYMTPVFEGASARAPRLVIEDGVIKVKLNSDTTGRGVRYTVIKYPS